MYSFYTDVYITKGCVSDPQEVSYQGRKYKIDKAKSTNEKVHCYNKELSMKVNKSELKLSAENI